MAYREARYDGDIRRAERAVGELVAKVEALGLADETLIVVTSDHGEDLGGRLPPEAVRQFGHSYGLYDELLLVPLILRHPGLLPAGRRIEVQVRTIDIAPTLLDYLGFEPPPTFEGESLRPLIDGRDATPRPAHSEATALGAEPESMRAGGYKYIHRLSYGDLTHPMARGMPLSPLHTLYHLPTDPGERRNLAGRRPEKIEALQGLIRAVFPNRTFTAESKPPPPAADDWVDDELRRKLRALGYLE